MVSHVPLCSQLHHLVQVRWGHVGLRGSGSLPKRIEASCPYCSAQHMPRLACALVHWATEACAAVPPPKAEQSSTITLNTYTLHTPFGLDSGFQRIICLSTCPAFLYFLLKLHFYNDFVCHFAAANGKPSQACSLAEASTICPSSCTCILL